MMGQNQPDPVWAFDGRRRGWSRPTRRSLAGRLLDLLVRRAMGGDLHDVRLVLSHSGIDAYSFCLSTSVTDRGVVRGRYRVRRVGHDADLIFAHGGAMRDEHVSRLHARQ